MESGDAGNSRLLDKIMGENNALLKNAPPVYQDAVARRVRAVRSSLTCFGVSLFGLVPICGIPFSIAALILARKVESRHAGDWNPAEHYLRRARKLAGVSFLTTAAFVFLLVMAGPPIWQDVTSCGSGSS